MCPSGMLRVGRQRVQRQRVLERDEQGWWGGHAAFFLRCSFLGWVSFSAAARRAWGVAVVQTGGCVRVCVGPTILVGTAPLSPPRCSTDPASPTAALQKGLCWGVCRLYPGSRGCVMWKRRRRRG